MTKARVLYAPAAVVSNNVLEATQIQSYIAFIRRIV